MHAMFKVVFKAFSIKSNITNARLNKHLHLDFFLMKGADPIIDTYANIVDPYVVYDEFYEIVEIASLRYDEDAITHGVIDNPTIFTNNVYSLNKKLNDTIIMEVKINFTSTAANSAIRLHKCNNGPLKVLAKPNKKLLGQRFGSISQLEWKPLGSRLGAGSRPFSRTLSRGAIVRKKASRESLLWSSTNWIGTIRFPIPQYAHNPLLQNNKVCRDFMLNIGRSYSTGLFPNWRIVINTPTKSLLLLMPTIF